MAAYVSTSKFWRLINSEAGIWVVTQPRYAAPRTHHDAASFACLARIDNVVREVIVLTHWLLVQDISTP